MQNTATRCVVESSISWMWIICLYYFNVIFTMFQFHRMFHTFLAFTVLPLGGMSFDYR